MYQLMNLENHGVEWLCSHLGHDLDIHKDFYRNMSSLVERLFLTKMLLIQDKIFWTDSKDRT